MHQVQSKNGYQKIGVKIEKEHTGSFSYLPVWFMAYSNF